jgi:DNA transformation protein
MADSDGFAEFVCEQLAPLGRITVRRMFGKAGVFCDGVMLGMLTDNTLYFRVDDQNRETFKEAASSPPLNYAKKGELIDLAFWKVPERLMDEPDELVEWGRAALAAARRVAAGRKRKGVPR